MTSTTLRRFRKKPVVIEAMRLQPDGSNGDEVAAWCGGTFETVTCFSEGPPTVVFIDTLEGRMGANRGDYVIRGVQGEFYPCKSDIFEATYERVADDERTDSMSEVRGDEAP